MKTKSALSRRQFLSRLGAASAGLLVAACRPAPAPNPTSQPAPTTAATTAPEQPPAATQVPETGGLPIVKEPLTLTYWMTNVDGRDSLLASMNDCTAYAECEKRTGIHIDFQWPSGGGDAAEQFGLMIASGQYPDIVEHGWFNAPGGPTRYLADKVILRLNEIIDQYAPNLGKILADHPDWRKQVVTDDGDLYVFPFLRGDPFLLTYGGPMMRADWLEKLDLGLPSTVDDWHTVLTAFKGQDPNGNGEADDIPFSPVAWGSNPLGAFGYYAFVGAWGVTMGFYQDKGKVQYGPLQPDFKEFLRAMAAWHQEGLIDPDFSATDSGLFDAKVTGGKLGSWIGNAGGSLGKYTTLMAEQDPAFLLAGAPYPVLQAGMKPEFGQRDQVYTAYAYCAAITTACKQVKEAAQWLDYKYGEEGHLLFMFGVEGVTYRMEDGYPRYTEAITKDPDGLSMSQALGKHVTINGPLVQDKRYFEQFLQYPQQKEAVARWSEPTCEKQMPPVTPTQEESKEYASAMNDIDTRFNEAIVKVINGTEPVEAWDDVLAELKQMGLDRALAIQQAALERYMQR